MPPPPPHSLVARPRLDLLVSAGTDAGLTLVSAPAGTGKTVAVADWASRRPIEPIWAAITAEVEQSPDQLWEELLEALRSRGITALRDKGTVRSEGSALFALRAGILESPVPVEIVLDFDTPVTRSMASGLDQLMRHTGDQLRLLLLTRQDPPMPLNRYLLAGRLRRVGAEDLAFTDDEAEQLVAARGLRLHRHALLLLTRRTRGWAAALVLASLLLTDETDPGAAVTKLTGRAGDLAEYMLTEVLNHQTADMRSVLLRTSIVDVLRPGLVERLAGAQAPGLLDALAGGGVFIDVAPTDRAGYRYHPLFRDMLHAQLYAEAPDQVNHLHRAASSWYASQGRLNEAISHLMAAGDWDAVADLVVDELAVVQLLLSQAPPGWVTAPLLRPLPETAGVPSASVVRAAQAVKNGDLTSARLHVNNARSRWATEQITSRQNLSLELVEMALAAAQEDWDTLITAILKAEVLQRQLATMMNRYPQVKSLLYALKGRALLARGDLEAANDAFSTGAGGHFSAQLDGTDARDTPGRPWMLPLAAAVADCLGHQALIAAWRGELSSADRLAQRCRALRASTGCGALVAPAPAPTALAWTCIERNDPSGARRLLQQAREEAGSDPDPFATVMLAVAGSRADRARDDIARATSSLTALPQAPHIPSWLQAHLRLEVARIHVFAGRTDKASALVDTLTAPAPEVEVVRAQAQLMAGNLPTAEHARAASNADLVTRVTSLVVEAATWTRRGQSGRARQVLNRSMRLARSEQLRRPFAEAPLDVVALIPGDADPALSHRGPAQPQRHAHPGSDLQTGADQQMFGPAPQTLTNRERQVLELMSDLLTNQEIARSLFVSVNTVRTHARAVLRKLGVARRGDAVRRARQLGLLSHTVEPDRSEPEAPGIPAQRTGIAQL